MITYTKSVALIRVFLLSVVGQHYVEDARVLVNTTKSGILKGVSLVK